MASRIRLTVAHVDDAGPVIVDGPIGPECLVVLWPSVDGRLIERAVLDGEHELRRWRLSPADVERLVELVSDWDLGRRDLIVSAAAIRPCRDTLRGSRVWPGHRLAKAA